MRTKIFRRLFAVVVCFMMVVTLLPIGELAYAGGGDLSIVVNGIQKDYWKTVTQNYRYYISGPEFRNGSNLIIESSWGGGSGWSVTEGGSLVSNFKNVSGWGGIHAATFTINVNGNSTGNKIVLKNSYRTGTEWVEITIVRPEEYKNFSLTPNIQNVTAAYAVSSNGTLNGSGLKSLSNGQTVTEKFNSNLKPGYMVVFVKPNENFLLTDLGASGANDLYDINRPISESRIKGYPGLQQIVDKAKNEGYVGYFGYSRGANDFANNSATFTSIGRELPIKLSAKVSKESVSAGDKVDIEILVEPRKIDGKDVRLDKLDVEEIKVGAINYANKVSSEVINGAYKKIIKDYVVKEEDIANGKVSINVKANAEFSFILYLGNSGQSILSNTISRAKLNKTVDAKIIQDYVDSTFTIDEFSNTANIEFKVLSSGVKEISLVDKDKNPLGPINSGTQEWKWSDVSKDKILNQDLSSSLDKLKNDKYFYYKITVGGKEYFERVEVISNGGTLYQSTAVEANLVVNETSNTYSLSFKEKQGQNIWRISLMDENKNILRDGMYFTKNNGNSLVLDNFTGFNDFDKQKIKNSNVLYLGIQKSSGESFTYEKIEITNKNGTNGLVSDNINFVEKDDPAYDQREFGFVINGDVAENIAGKGKTEVSFVIKNDNYSTSSTADLAYNNGYKYNLVLKDANAIKEADATNTNGANKVQVEVTNEHKNKTVLVAAVVVNTRGPVIKTFEESKAAIGDYIGTITDTSSDLKIVKVEFGGDGILIDCKVNDDKRTFTLEYEKYKDKDLSNVDEITIHAVDINNNGSRTQLKWENRIEDIITGLVDPNKNEFKTGDATIVSNVRQFFGVEYKYVVGASIEIATNAARTQGYEYKIYEVGNRNKVVDQGTTTTVSGSKIKITPSSTELVNGKKYIVVVTLSIKPVDSQEKVKFTTDYITPRGAVQDIKEIKINNNIILQ